MTVIGAENGITERASNPNSAEITIHRIEPVGIYGIQNEEIRHGEINTHKAKTREVLATACLCERVVYKGKEILKNQNYIEQ